MSMEERYIYKIPVGFEAEIKEDMVVMRPKKESEDERIGKEIIEYIKVSKPYWSDFKDYRSWVAWLEKQKEQQPVEWSEEDEKMLTEIINSVNGFDAFTGIILQNSEQHERKINWLKSLRSRPKSSDNWKPSEEQMEALEQAKISAECGNFFTKDGLKSLYDDLKKL